ncbi:junctional cadherin 5-associated protein [Heteronotia binoei]|uniref:junctional cadherin 5-associated protein n=1 Tax=Heteronotia binoei TaxID=13085 RepID=UPI00292FD9D6|nr:junctional cadherin 5-associated protein [Heteronotia binoei]XP_060104207.1 junctional cadherin 5-associated protein [Heteronotia binoei]XP_060104208.1 junctional cadherin 5-associated protein [Heteronotia binoei]
MFSVEDLLISHGYKLSKTPASLYENRCDGNQHELAERRPVHGTLNGLPTNSGAYACVKKTATKSHLNDNESSYISQGQQPGSVYQKDFQSLANTHASEGRFYDQPQVVSSLHPKTDKDLAYWRRRGQDFSSLFGYTDRGDSEMKGIAAPRVLYGHDKDGQWEVGGGTERTRRTGLQEKWNPPGDYRWHSLRTEGWNLPTKLVGLMSDGDRERLLQDPYSVRHGGEAAVASRNKGKSQSLPRVLSPESLRYVEMPSLVNNHSLSGTKTTSHPKTGLAQGTSKHTEQTAPFLPLPKPKYGRPLKPPSYELHWQTRGRLETHLLQDGQQKEEATSYLTKGNEHSQDGSAQDPSLEPPGYIPPPCYKSPVQQSTNQRLPNKVPEYDMCFNNSLQHPVERAILSYQPSGSNGGTRDQHCKNEQIPHDQKRPRKHVESHLSSVQYIPFDDPRIRHIKIAHADSFQESKVDGDANRESPCAFQESALELEYNSAFLDVSDSLASTAVKCHQVSGGSVNGSRWLAESNIDQDDCALPIQRDCYDAGSDTSHQYSKSRLLAQSPPAELPHETVTKVKTFEPGTEVQSKRSSKKKMNETIFCLVSVPVKSELNLPDTDRNNNLTQGAVEKNGFDNSGVLQEQSLLSTSSTDLELQALTGNMTNKNELQKQESWRPEFKQTNDLRLLQTTKHKELQYSGSWPSDHYKDQQTQTSFAEEPKHLQLSHDFEPTGLTKGPSSLLLRNAVSITEPVMSTALPADDRKHWQDAYRVKSEGYLDTSSSRLVSRTAVVAPKACQKNPPCALCSRLPGEDRETSCVLREDASATRSSKELFGQFLLKPVGRRPWDVISELESFNKELQEQEESNEDGVEKEDKQERGEEKGGSQENETCRIEGMSQDCRPSTQSETDMLVAPVFQQVREKSKAEHFNQSESSRARVLGNDFRVYGRSQSCLHAKEVGESVRPGDGYVTAEPRKWEVGGRIMKEAGSPCPVKKVLLDSYSDGNHDNPFNGVSFSETAHIKNYRDDAVRFDRITNNVVPWNNLAFERGSGVRLSLTNRTHGLSEPDLRSVGLENGHAPGAMELDYGKPEVTEIPSNESLQERAARILGIDVAVESLVPSSRALQEEHFDSDSVLQGLELSAERALGRKREAETTSYEGRRKCGWMESSLFVGDKNVLLDSMEDQKSDQEAALEKQHCEPHRGLDRQGEDQNPPPDSVALPFCERNSVLSGVEKRVRSTSKVIETLQGKLASPPSRAGMDRLVRMKEVDSVSRMRRLSIKNADSVEDGDEDKQVRKVEERGNGTSLGSNELARKMSHGSSVSKRIISLAENGLSDNISDRKTGRDLFCLDAYDPTRVERV